MRPLTSSNPCLRSESCPGSRECVSAPAHSEDPWPHRAIRLGAAHARALIRDTQADSQTPSPLFSWPHRAVPSQGQLGRPCVHRGEPPRGSAELPSRSSQGPSGGWSPCGPRRGAVPEPGSEAAVGLLVMGSPASLACLIPGVQRGSCSCLTSECPTR